MNVVPITINWPKKPGQPPLHISNEDGRHVCVLDHGTITLLRVEGGVLCLQIGDDQREVRLKAKAGARWEGVEGAEFLGVWGENVERN